MGLIDRLFGREGADSRKIACDAARNQSVPVASVPIGTTAHRPGASPPDRPEVLRRMSHETRALVEKALAGNGDCTVAHSLCLQTIEAQERVLGPDHPDTIETVNSLAALLTRAGDYDGAQRLLLRAVGSSERALGPDHPDTLICLMNLAGVLVRQGDLAGAANLYSRSLGGGFKLASMKRHCPHVDACIRAYVDCLSALGHSDDRVRSMVAELGRPYGIAPLWKKEGGGVIVGG